MSTCAKCGILFRPGRSNQRFCSEQCRRSPVAEKTIRCRRCDAEMVVSGKAARAKKYCAPCAEKSTRERNASRGADSSIHARENRVCKVCSASFVVRAKSPSRCCSSQCARIASGRALQKTFTCQRCNREFTNKRGSKTKNLFCSRECAFSARREGIAAVVACPDKKVGIGGSERRARLLGRIVERLNALQVFDRDNWTCGICGETVDKFLAWPHPQSASLDHIIPLSVGGHHTESNVQCSHFACNMAKRDSAPPLLQLQLY